MKVSTVANSTFIFAAAPRFREIPLYAFNVQPTPLPFKGRIPLNFVTDYVYCVDDSYKMYKRRYGTRQTYTSNHIDLGYLDWRGDDQIAADELEMILESNQVAAAAIDAFLKNEWKYHIDKALAIESLRWTLIK